MSFLPTIIHPLGELLSSYDRTKPPAAQGDLNLHVFAQAMEIREAVFVKEQHVPLENELDEDDARSFHWVVYAHISKTPKPFVLDSERTPEDLAEEAAKRQKEMAEDKKHARSRVPTSTRVAVGTVRLVPPHKPHYAQSRLTNTEGKIPKAPATFKLGDGSGDEADTKPNRSTITPNKEPYVKLGRLAVVREFRGLSLGKLLVDTALEFATDYPYTLVPRLDIIEREHANLRERRRLSASATSAPRGASGLVERSVDADEWKGLVCVHAQVQTEAMYRRWGFEKDEGMGTWWEEGIEHVGMWRRLEIRKDDPRHRRASGPNRFV